MAIISLLAPIVLELLKIIFGGSSNSDKEKALQEVREQLAKIRAAIGKAEETGGDTSDLEKIINGRK